MLLNEAPFYIQDFGFAAEDGRHFWMSIGEIMQYKEYVLPECFAPILFYHYSCEQNEMS